jgi:hypothetical protein
MVSVPHGTHNLMLGQHFDYLSKHTAKHFWIFRSQIRENCMGCTGRNKQSEIITTSISSAMQCQNMRLRPGRYNITDGRMTVKGNLEIMLSKNFVHKIKLNHFLLNFAIFNYSGCVPSFSKIGAGILPSALIQIRDRFNCI